MALVEQQSPVLDQLSATAAVSTDGVAQLQLIVEQDVILLAGRAVRLVRYPAQLSHPPARLSLPPAR